MEKCIVTELHNTQLEEAVAQKKKKKKIKWMNE